MDFEIVIDTSLLELQPQVDPDAGGNKYLLSLVNDFEDGQWQYSEFQNFIWDNIAETALSQRERECLQYKPQSQLVEAAKNLRLVDNDKDEVGRGSELAEIVLYGVMKKYFKALPVVPKIFYKQNDQDNAKGADSVHVVIHEENTFSLWYGEAKFYNSIEDKRLDSIIKSVGNSLETKKIKKENKIISNVRDLEGLVADPKLVGNIYAAISSGSIDRLKPNIHIPILLLHECQNTCNAKEMTDDYIRSISSYHKDRACSYFSRQLKKLKDTVHKYSDITFHLILIPVPDKRKIVDSFVKSVEFYKGV